MVPSATPSTVRGIGPSWLAGYISTLILPPLLDSTPALKAFIHSCETSLIVGDDSFMVNCCADAENATASRMPAIQILLMLPLLVTQKQLDPHQRNPGDVRDQQQRDEI